MFLCYLSDLRRHLQIVTHSRHVFFDVSFFRRKWWRISAATAVNRLQLLDVTAEFVVHLHRRTGSATRRKCVYSFLFAEIKPFSVIIMTK